MKKDKKLFLLDAYALIYRAYYAFINRQMLNSKGLNTSAIFGFTVTLEEILRNEKPSHIAVVFDPPSPTFRHEMYTEYKANRETTPEEIKQSVPYIKSIIDGFNIPVIEVNGYEADDVIGTLSKMAEKKGFEVYMMTPDKDYAQLVSENVFMYKPRKGTNQPEVLGPEQIKELFHVENPVNVIDVMALWGDTSDNIPGAPGIGEKTAKKLISEYGNLDNLLKNLDDLKGKQQENIKNNIEQIYLSKELVTIKLDVPVEFNENNLEFRGIDKEKLSALFDELEFRTIKDRILTGYQEEVHPGTADQPTLWGDNGAFSPAVKAFGTIDTREHTYHLCKSPKDIDALVEKLKNAGAFCFDTETTDINPLKAELVGIAFSIKSAEAYYVPVDENRDKAMEQLKPLVPIFEDKAIGKIGQNIKYDIQVLKNYNIGVKGQIFDTMIAHYLLQPDLKHSLNALSENYLNYRPVSITDLIGKKGSQQGNMRQVSEEKVSDYACEDADLTWELFTLFKPQLEQEKLLELAETVEFPLIPVLADMERAGIKLDIESLSKYSVELRDEITTLQQEIYTLTGYEFNISSPKQLGEILFDRMKISSDVKKTKTNTWSTSEDILLRLTNKHPVVQKILDYRSLTKLLSTYVEALPKLINEETGKLHSSFNQAVAATGRLSSNNPNMQNIPIREERGREIRKSFIPSSEDYILFSADYSQIELRLMAHMSGSRDMISAFRNNEDIHQSTASKIYNVKPQDVTREMRSSAKTANFGIIYGISAFGLSQRLNIGRKEAKELIDGYFDSFPGVKEYMEQSIHNAREKGYVETILGRKRHLKDINSRNAIVRGFAERNAINAPIQGSAADIIKLAMIRINKKLIEQNLQSKMILQVHDELVFDVYKPELEKVKEIAENEMINAIELDVPLIVESGSGDNWLEAH
ncbi:MAG: DNA polymerase I [Bacteroidales bacterium]|nr:DNA polymerase I [Bacteroidales bacterium]